MVQFMLNLLLMISSIIFVQLKHPLAMGFLLLIQTLTICLISGIMIESFWFSYILFLVFLGGMLVMFIYVASLASNEMFNFSFKIMYLSMIFLILLFTSFCLFKFMNLNLLNNGETNSPMSNYLMKENYESIFKLFNYPTNLMTILLINYLFFTLIVTVKVTNFFYGPIRNLN